MNVAVVGSRDFSDYNIVKKYLDMLDISKIISGGAAGADQLAKRYAMENHHGFEEILPNWKKYSKKAGPLRNKEIVAKADFIIAFWNGVSPGTRGTINFAKSSRKEIWVVRADINFTVQIHDSNMK